MVILPAHLTAAQREIVAFSREGGERLFVRGLPGTGKTTALMARLAALLREGRRPYEVLVLVPQRAQGDRYDQLLASLDAPTRGGVDALTYYSLARRSVALFWPLVARTAGFAHPDHEPIFLTIETTQYFMWRIVEPLMAKEGYFNDLAIRRGRLLSQLIDNLNKSALVGFDHTDLLRRLRVAWTGSQDHINRYWQAQDCAIRFREYCLAHNLLDFSLTTEVFSRHLASHEVYQRYFAARYRHLLADNLEENVPVAHQFLDWAGRQCCSTVLACDDGGGYRVFLGADAEGAYALGARGDRTLVLSDLLEPTADPLALADRVRRVLRVESAIPTPATQGRAERAIVDQGGGRFWISMIHWVVERIAERVSAGTPPEEIAIVAPYVSEVMRFAIEEELHAKGLPLFLLRPATAFRDVPVIRGLLTLVRLAHPNWEIAIQGETQALPIEDVALALEVALDGLDPIRARHLARAALPLGQRSLADLSDAKGAAGQSNVRLWEYVGYQVRERYETLRVWIETYCQSAPEPVDVLLSKLFGDLLSHPGYGFHDALDKARDYGRLVESANKFRDAVGQDPALDGCEVAREYVQLILGGTAAAEYLLDWPRNRRGGVILAPAYAYLTREMRSTYQFWIDLGSDGWWNRPNQPLTNPYVLSLRWPVGQPWRDVEEDRARREALARVLQGLAARCRGGIYLAYSELGLDGVEQDGRLQRTIQLALAGRMRPERQATDG